MTRQTTRRGRGLAASRLSMRGLFLTGVLITCPGLVLAQNRTLKLEFSPDGTVTLAAANVSMRDIVLEWARLCGCYVVNGDRVSAAALPVPLEFTRVPQGRVLEALLRQTTGYALTPRRPGHAGISQYETIYIVASSQASSAAAPPAFAPVVRPAPIAPTPGAPDDEIPPVQPLLPPLARPGGTQEPPVPEPPAAAPRPPGVSVPAVVVPIGPGGGTPPAPAPGMPTPIPQAQPAPQSPRP